MNHTPTPNSAPVDIQRLRELESKATPGPWGAHWIQSHMAFAMTYKNADFIAALRNAAPALLDEVTQLREISAHEDRLRQFSSRIAGMLYLDTEEVDLSDAIQALSELLVERDKLREEVEISKECNQLLNGTLDIAKANLDFLRQQNEQLLKEIGELRARPTGIWKENY